MDPTTYGPYETERETFDSPLLQQVRDLVAVHGIDQNDINRNHLVQAYTAAGVPLGDYDRQIVGWLTNYEPQTVQVLIGIISRAYASGVKAGAR